MSRVDVTAESVRPPEPSCLLEETRSDGEPVLPRSVVCCCDSCLLLATLAAASCADAEEPLPTVKWLKERCGVVFAA